jgi:hypothetical protein
MYIFGLGLIINFKYTSGINCCKKAKFKATVVPGIALGAE